MDIETDLETITQQEKALVLPHFDSKVAWELGTLLRELTISRNQSVAIQIGRFGHVLFYTSLHGATPDNANWIRRKANTVAQFLTSSYKVGLNLKKADTTLNLRYALSEADFSAHGGGFPLSVAGAGVIGSIVMSGFPQRDDHGYVVEGLCAYLKKDYSSFALRAS